MINSIFVAKSVKISILRVTHYTASFCAEGEESPAFGVGRFASLRLTDKEALSFRAEGSTELSPCYNGQCSGDAMTSSATKRPFSFLWIVAAAIASSWVKKSHVSLWSAIRW